MTELVGYAGMVVGVLFMAPQVYHSWKTKSVADLSWLMLFLYLLNTILWFTYGVLIGSAPLVLTNILAFAVAGSEMTLKVYYE